MPEVQKYGKSSAEVIAQKNSFFEENAKHLAVEKKIAKVYAEQPLRTRCKNCDAILPDGFDFIEVDTEYIFCDVCGHLNGRHEDSDAFCDYVYNGDAGESYGLNYSVADRKSYQRRIKTIYLPKAKFLLDVLTEDAQEVKKLRYMDFGAGSGYLVSALKMLNVDVKGLEISASQVDFANSMMQEELLEAFSPQETQNKIENTRREVFSMIGVLEHLQEPRAALQAIRENKAIKYIYISVPLFSFSVFFEKLSPEIFSRQLSGGHNHLYTEESLHYMFHEFDFEVVGEWWFGSDMMDVFRHVEVMMQKSSSSDKVRAVWQKSFGKVIDEMQLVLDERHLSSEVHMVLKKAVH